MPKVKKVRGKQEQPKVSLGEEIDDAKFAKPKNRNKIRFRQEEEQVRLSYCYNLLERNNPLCIQSL